MSGKQAVIAVPAGMSVLGGSAAAQDEKNESTGVIGRIFISDQGISGATNFNAVVRSGAGLTFEVNYARRLFGNPVLRSRERCPQSSTSMKTSTPATMLFLKVTNRYSLLPRLG